MDMRQCYVCGGPISHGALYIGQGLYRHRSSCEPGSVRYMQNEWLAREYLSLFGKDVAMKKDEVRTGGTYAAKVSDKVVPVRLDAENPRGGWDATNLATGKRVRIKSAQRLRNECTEDGTAVATPNTGATGAKKAASKSKGAAPKKRAPRAKTGAQGKTSGLDAAAKVLEEAGEPLNCKQIVERAFEKGYWQSGGKTPWATIYSAILREVQNKGDNARFRKAARGRFELAR